MNILKYADLFRQEITRKGYRQNPSNSTHEND
jgi:hypothetical protein